MLESVRFCDTSVTIYTFWYQTSRVGSLQSGHQDNDRHFADGRLDASRAFLTFRVQLQWGAIGKPMAGFGETLRQARALKSVTLKEAEQSTRINRHHLAALEDESFDALPPLIYQRGIVRNYAVYLDLDPGRMLALFEEAHGTVAGSGVSGGVMAVPPIDMPRHWAPNFAIIAFSVVLSAIVFAWVYSAYVAPSEEVATATLVVPTMTPIESDIVIPTEPPASATTVPTQVAAPTATAVVPNGSTIDQATVTPKAGNAGQGDNQRIQAPTAAAKENSAIQIAPTATATSAGNDTTAARNQQRLITANASGAPIGGIVITGNADITLKVTIDGTVEFDGTLAAGASTDEFIGTNYEIETSSGTNTVFTNACGTQFNMGFEAGAVTYTFPADGSCTPPQ